MISAPHKSYLRIPANHTLFLTPQTRGDYNTVMNRVARFLNNRMMWSKLVLCYSIVLLIPIGICFYLATEMRLVVTENAHREMARVMDRVALRVEQSLDSIVSASSGIVYNAALIDTVASDYPTDYDLVSAMWKSGDLSPYLKAYENAILEIRLYVDDNRVFTTGTVLTTPDDVRKENWYQKALSGKTPPFWVYAKNQNYFNKNGSSLSLIRPVYDGLRVLGVLSLHVHPALLNDIFAQESTLLMLCGEDGTILASGENAYLGQSLSLALESLPTMSIYSAPLAIGQTEGAFELLAVYSEQEILVETAETIRNTLSISVFGALLSLAFILIVSRLLSARLRRMGQNIHRAASGDLDFTPVIDGGDEIGALSRDFDQMLASIRTLIRENYEIQLQKQALESAQKDIQMRVLSSQLNPHFLFNALEGIRMRAVTLRQNDIADSVRMLSSLLRRSLYTKNELIPIEEELDFVEDYLKIQVQRFGDRLHYRIDTFTEPGAHKVLPFLIQPLVENAVKHGIEDAAGDTHFVSVSVLTEENRLLVLIADNGVGMDEATLKRVSRSLMEEDKDPPSTHIGIINVNRRIRLYYGPSYGLSIASGAGKGVIATLTLPKGGDTDV